MSAPQAIEVRDIWKSFGDRAVLKGVSFAVPEGSVRVILGGSGSGKTVIMKHIIGLLKPDRGEVLVYGQDIVPLTGEAMVAMRKSFGMVFQTSALFDSMTVFDNVAFPLVEGGQKLGKDEIRNRVVQKLEALGLGDALEKYPSELSGGMKKRTGLARALVSEPRIILYDEPTTGLDPITTDNVDQMILDAKNDFGVTSVVISHDIASALKVADSVAFLHDGRIVADTTPAELRKSEHPFVREFLSTWFGK